MFESPSSSEIRRGPGTLPADLSAEASAKMEIPATAKPNHRLRPSFPRTPLSPPSSKPSRQKQIPSSKTGALLSVVVFLSLCLEASVNGQEALKLDAPSNWKTELVKLPPRFAPKLGLKGNAIVYFSPGWSRRKSDQFFTYTFLFKTEAEPKFDEQLIKKELLTYFGGLAARVSRGKVDPATFEMEVNKVEPVSGEKQASANDSRFAAQLKWTDPFFTKSAQTLNMELVSRFSETEKANYLLVCVSPQDPKDKAEGSSKVWQELREIQESFINPKKIEAKEMMGEEKKSPRSL